MLSIHFSPKHIYCLMILSKYSKTFRNPSGIHLWSTGKNLQVLKVGNASKEEEEYKNPVFCVWKSMRIIWIRFLPLRDGHSAFQLTLQVLEAPLFPWASCRILIPLKSNCKSLMNYDLVSKIVCPCALAYLVMIDGKRFFLYLSVFFSIPFNISPTICFWQFYAD